MEFSLPGCAPARHLILNSRLVHLPLEEEHGAEGTGGETMRPGRVEGMEYVLLHEPHRAMCAQLKKYAELQVIGTVVRRERERVMVQFDAPGERPTRHWVIESRLTPYDTGVDPLEWQVTLRPSASFAEVSAFALGCAPKAKQEEGTVADRAPGSPAAPIRSAPVPPAGVPASVLPRLTPRAPVPAAPVSTAPVPAGVPPRLSQPAPVPVAPVAPARVPPAVPRGTVPTAPVPPTAVSAATVPPSPVPATLRAGLMIRPVTGLPTEPVTHTSEAPVTPPRPPTPPPAAPFRRGQGDTP